MIRNIEVLMAQAMSKSKRPPLMLPYALASFATPDAEQTEGWPKYLSPPVGMGFLDVRFYRAVEEAANEKAL